MYRDITLHIQLEPSFLADLIHAYWQRRLRVWCASWVSLLTRNSQMP